MTLKTLLLVGAATALASVSVIQPALADGFPGAPVRHAAVPKRHAPKPRVRIVYVDRPVVVEKKVTVYVDRPVTVEKVVEKPVIVERPVVVEKRVDVPVERIVEKPVYIDRPVDT